MTLRFETIDFTKKDAFSPYYECCPQKTSDYSFVNLWGWASIYGLKWAWADHLVWIKATLPQNRFWAPVGDWKKVFWQKAIDLLTDGGTPVTFVRIPELLLSIWQENIDRPMDIKETRGEWDYLYSVKALVELKGNRYHKKKNLLNQFKKKYAYRYIPFDVSLVEDALALQDNWCTWRDCESSDMLSAENRVIAKIFKYWNELDPMIGGALFVDDQMAAYTIGEKLDPKSLVIHFEKGDPVFKGVYQAINQMFLSQTADGFDVVNREQDIDDPGLRKAKLSYHPIAYNKKYQVTFT